MILYIFPIIISLFGTIFYDINGQNKGKKLTWGILFVYMTLFMGLRYGVGGDTIIYMNDYEWIPDIKDYTIISLNRYDPGFNFIMSIGHTISSQFVAFQFLHILILNSLLFSIITKYSKYRFSVFFCSLFIFYYYFATEILREALAVLIFVYFYQFYEKRQWGKFILLVVLCALMHRGAIFLFFLPLMRYISFNKYYPLMIIGSFILGGFMRQIFGFLNFIVFFADSTQSYQASTSHGIMADLLELLRQAVFPLLTAILVMNFYKCKTFRFDNMIAILILFGILAFFSPIIFSRICNYFIVFFTVTLGDLLPSLLRSSKQISKRNALIVCFAILAIYGSSFVMYNYYSRLIPYFSVFNPKMIDRDNFN